MARYPNELVVSGRYRPHRLSDLVGDLMTTYEQRKDHADPVLTAWQRVIPPGLAEHCRIASVAGSCLRVVVDSPAYLYELKLCREELVRSMQDLCKRPRITILKLTLG